jgi:methyl-accepting chemotaxis protein
MAFKPWERVITDIRLIPKMVILMVFSTLLIIAKQLGDASTFYQALLDATQHPDVAQQYYDEYIMTMVWQTIGMIIIFIVILLFTARIMLRQTEYISRSIQTLASRNLSDPIELDCKDEYGDLARELEKTRRQLQDVIKLQVGSSEELASLSEVMSIAMSETLDSAKEEFNEVDQLATAMSQMSSAVQTVAEHAQTASGLTEEATSKAQTGQDYVQGSMFKMKDLSHNIAQSAEAITEVEERVAAISSVVGTIQSISGQTNLLALNAAIEAARAGEAGRGFAVVADEVRSLAQRTQKATVEIQDMIGFLQTSANAAVELMEKSVVEAAEGVSLVSSAGTELSGIVEQIKQINVMNFEIADAAGEQTTVANEMNSNLSNVKELVEASVEVVTELLETAQMMENNVAELDQKISSFKI